MKVSKWGNSLAIRLPAHVVQRLGLKEGDQLIEAPGFGEEKQVLIRRQESAEELWNKLDETRNRLKRPKGYKFDRDEANSRGR